MASKWLEINIKLNREAADIIAAFLNVPGRAGVSISDPLLYKELQGSYLEELPPLQQGNDEELVVSVYYPLDDNSGDKVFTVKEELSRLSEHMNIGSGEVSIRTVEEQQWEQAWKTYYKPLRVGKKLVICPSCENYTQTVGDVIITLDPGMAFGTGTHPTTRMCLQNLEKYLPPNSSVLDIGTGSGILAIAAVKLGASKVIATDIDSMAVHVCQENAAINNVKESISTFTGNLLENHPSGKFTVICANIIADVIKNLIPQAEKFIEPGGLFIASGIIKEKSEEIKAALARHKLYLIEETNLEGWVCLTARKEGKHASVLY